MKFALLADGQFVQAALDVNRLLCSNNQYITWWNAMGYAGDIATDLIIKENATERVLYKATYARRGALRWKEQKD